MNTFLLQRARVGACVCALVAALTAGAALAQDIAGELRALIESGEYRAAAERARDATSREPDRGPLWIALGEALFAVGDIDGARQAFSRASNLDGEGRIKAMLNVGLTLQYQGERMRATTWFKRVLDHYNANTALSSAELAAVARAAQELGVSDPGLFHDAVRVYGEAITSDATNVAARVALGELLLAKYNNTEALQTFREALTQAPTDAPALLGLARSQHFDHASDALRTAQDSLEQNANYVPARAFLARLFIESEQYEQAEREAMKALQVNPNSLETLAVLAAVYFLTDEEQKFKSTVARCLSINARYADLYNTLAELSVQNRLYHDAVSFARRAVELDPNSWRGFGLLGLNQLRIGDIEGGRVNLERAFAGDPFNVWTKNTLDLMDTFVEYEVIRHGPFALALHRSEARLLTPYLIELAQQAYDHFRRQYEYEPAAPIRIELYPSHADFSVRTVGLAGIGILGVSFGPVVALDSPSARAVGGFNWGSALWHELAHTFHLGMTRHRVPRWFSEGLAVYEERRAREGWGGDPTPAFLKAYRDGNLFPVSELNNGFVRPNYPEQVVHSYYQASLVFAYIDQRWGFSAIRGMLNGYRDGQSTPQVFRAALNLTMSEFDSAFDDYFRARFAHALRALAAQPSADAPVEETRVRPGDETGNEFERQMRAGVEALAAKDYSQAETHLLRAQALFPEYAGHDSAYWYLAELYGQRGEHAQAAAQLERMVSINADHYEAHVKLAELRDTLGDAAAAADALARAIYIYPFELPLHERLARLYGQSDEWSRAAQERAAVVALNPVDMAEARYQLAYAFARAGERTAARRELLRALELAPNFPEALELLLELRAGTTSGDAAGPPPRPPAHTAVPASQGSQPHHSTL